jgi:acyl-CoA synthetase (AMP-forming)/AMP-acid ligase II
LRVVLELLDLARRGSRPALIGEDGAVTYAELAERVRDRAATLGPGRRLIMVRARNDVESLVSYLAALAGGHVCWLVQGDAGWGSAALEARFGPDVVTAGERVEERREGSAHAPHHELALLLGTSGSTGSPRLVRLSAENLRSNAAAIAAYLGLGPEDRGLTSLPVHYCYGLSVVNAHLAAGAALLVTGRSVTDPALWELARESGATGLAGVPHTFALLDRVGFAEMDLPRLRYVTQAGGRLAPEEVRRWAGIGARRGWRLVVMYGQTEATARMAYLPPELAAEAPGAVGIPIPGGAIELRPVPEHDEPGVGEIVYRGPNVMLGYAHEPADLALPRTVTELRTGDLGRRDARGLLEVVGRRARFVKPYGLRIDLDALERMLAAEGVPALCAGDDRRVVVATAAGREDEVADLLAGRLGLPAGALSVVTAEDPPRLPSGKPDYAALLARATTPVAAPAGDVAAAFREVLGVREVRDGDTFASLGGDSLSYVEMSVALEELLGRVPSEWPRMTVAELAAREPAPRGRGTRLETGVALRGGAIMLVVASHMTAFWPAGGAHLLLALAGHSFARFQLAAAATPGRLARWGAAAARIALPTSAWIGLQMLLAGGYSAGALLLVNGYTGDPALTGRRWEYWFVEALVQLLLATTLLFAIPAVRRWGRAHGLRLALALLGGTLAAGLGAAAAGADNHLFKAHAVAWLFALGWAAELAATARHRLLLSAVAVGAAPLFFPSAVQATVVAGGLLALLWLPGVVVPRPVGRALAAVAAASLAIYLTHWQVWPGFAGLMPLPLAFAATLAVGVGAWMAVGGALALVRRRRAARPALEPAASAV